MRITDRFKKSYTYDIRSIHVTQQKSNQKKFKLFKTQ